MAIRKAAVLGAGAMGSRIAAHLANAGLPVVLLDIPPDNAARALDALTKARPAAFYDAALAAQIETGNFDDDLARLAGCDWVIEAVTENLAIKQALLVRVVPHLKDCAILTTNTSGLGVAAIAAALPESVRRRWFGAHFFNPPRYMRLVEIVAAKEADREAVAEIAEFADVRLGKEVVFARDTPNFIANRIGVFAMLEAMRLMDEEALSIEEVDALTGTAIGWPRTGTFRLADLIGLDVLADVAANFPRERAPKAPAIVRTLIERRWLGDKTKQGFYKKDGGTLLALDAKTLEYRVAERPAFPAKAARFHWRLLSSLWNYTADCLPEIADDVRSVDRALRSGFNWERGPFELWDAAGVRATIERMQHAGEPASAVAQAMLASGAESWYRNGEQFDPAAGAYRAIPEVTGIARVARFRAANGVIRGNGSASLIDLEDGIACIELHPPSGAIDRDAALFIQETLAAKSPAIERFRAFVITGDGAHFSLAAPMLAEAEGMADAVQRSARPVAAAPFGTCVDGGAMLARSAARVQAHAELSMGFTDPPGKLSTSALDARRLGYLTEADGITMNRERLLSDAKAAAIRLADAL